MRADSQSTKRLLSFSLLAAALATPAPAADGALKLPAYSRFQLDNGLTLLLMEKRGLPLVNLEFVVRAGSVNDPEGEEGLALLTAELLRKGTASRSADEISGELDFMGARFSAGADLDFSYGSAEFLSKDLEKGLDLLADLLQRPAFPEEEVKKLIEQQIGAVRSSRDNPREVQRLSFNAYLFGDHPYGRPVGGDERSLAAIQASDPAKFYRQHYRASNLILAAVGDFETARMKEAIEKKFGAWSAEAEAEAETPPLAQPSPVVGKRLLLVDKPDATQTFFSIGNLGVSRTNPDRVAIRVVNTIFGGRFTSLLNSELRIRSGLTYGARSRFDMNRLPGSFAISSFTPTESTVKAIDLALEVLEKLHREGVSAELLESAKNYVKGQYPLDVETGDQLADLLAELELYGLGAEEVDQLYAKIDALTVEDARRVIARCFPRENLVFTLVGKASEVRDQVAKYAPRVDSRSVSDPGF